MRLIARRIRVSESTPYRHFSTKEDLLASVATEGFMELTATLDEVAKGPDPQTRLGLAYVDFALRKRGLFRLMFGPILVERARFTELAVAFDVVRRTVTGVEKGSLEDNSPAISAWCLVHGLSALFVNGLVPEAKARVLAEEILVRRRPVPQRH
jgi:AcrR family transcriptional regulator